MLRSQNEQWKILDMLKRKLFLKNQLKILLLKNIEKNKKIPLSNRYLCSWYKTQLSRNSSKTKIQDRCVVTGRIWSVNKQTKYSRFKFRTEAYVGNLPGFKRASW